MPLYLCDKPTHQQAPGCPQKATLFLHIPKTGGTSIESWLADVYSTPAQYLSKEKHPNEESTPQHFGYHKLKGLVGEVNQPLFTFAIVRNPYHRLESEFFYRLQAKYINLGPGAETMFSAWVCDMLQKVKTHPHMLDNHLQPQVYYYHKDLTMYKFEDGFEAIVQSISAQLGVVAPHSLAAKKVSKKKPVVWSNQAIAMVNSAYKADFTTFDYAHMGANKKENPSLLLLCKLKYRMVTTLRQIKHAIVNKA